MNFVVLHCKAVVRINSRLGECTTRPCLVVWYGLILPPAHGQLFVVTNEKTSYIAAKLVHLK